MPKKVLCATVIVDVFGSPEASGKEIAAIERVLRKALLSLRPNLKRKGFVLRVTR